MPDFAPSVTRLIDELKRLPGIGQKTAQRLAFYLLRVDPEQAFALSDAIRDAKEKVRECSICNNITDADPCLFCTGPSRSKKIICVVEEATNIQAVEKTRGIRRVVSRAGRSAIAFARDWARSTQDQEFD